MLKIARRIIRALMLSIIISAFAGLKLVGVVLMHTARKVHGVAEMTL